jgi:hypothetical protein
MCFCESCLCGPCFCGPVPCRTRPTHMYMYTDVRPPHCRDHGRGCRRGAGHACRRAGRGRRRRTGPRRRRAEHERRRDLRRGRRCQRRHPGRAPGRRRPGRDPSHRRPHCCEHGRRRYSQRPFLTRATGQLAAVASFSADPYGLLPSARSELPMGGPLTSTALGPSLASLAA